MRATKMRCTFPDSAEGMSIAVRLDELKAQLDAISARARANLDAQHAAVDAEITALLACVRRVQAQMGDGWTSTEPVSRRMG